MPHEERSDESRTVKRRKIVDDSASNDLEALLTIPSPSLHAELETHFKRIASVLLLQASLVLENNEKETERFRLLEIEFYYKTSSTLHPDPYVGKRSQIFITSILIPTRLMLIPTS